jgi:hypothetical protein
MTFSPVEFLKVEMSKIKEKLGDTENGERVKMQQ